MTADELAAMGRARVAIVRAVRQVRRNGGNAAAIAYCATAFREIARLEWRQLLADDRVKMLEYVGEDWTI